MWKSESRTLLQSDCSFKQTLQRLAELNRLQHSKNILLNLAARAQHLDKAQQVHPINTEQAPNTEKCNVKRLEKLVVTTVYGRGCASHKRSNKYTLKLGKLVAVMTPPYVSFWWHQSFNFTLPVTFIGLILTQWTVVTTTLISDCSVWETFWNQISYMETKSLTVTILNM